MKKNNNGFTLLEVLIASAILAIILTMSYSILITTLDSRSFIEKRAHTERVGSKLLNFISRDLQGAYMYQIENDNFFVGKSQGKNTRVDFICNTDSILLAPDGGHSDLCEVGYFLRSNQDGTFRIIRREDFFIDDNPTEGGTGIKLFDAIDSFELRFYEKNNALSSWNSKEKKKLPDAVEIQIGIKDNDTVRIFKSIVPINVSNKIPKKEKKSSKEDGQK